MDRDAPIEEVNERWRLRNGAVVIITNRAGTEAVGSIEGTLAVLAWHSGKSASGTGYDLMEQIDGIITPDNQLANLIFEILDSGEMKPRELRDEVLEIVADWKLQRAKGER